MADTHPGPCHVFFAHGRSQLSEFLDTNDRFSEFAGGKLVGWYPDCPKYTRGMFVTYRLQMAILAGDDGKSIL